MKFILFVSLFLFAKLGYSEGKVKIIFYPQTHYAQKPTQDEARSGLLSQLLGLIELNKLIAKDPNIPIFEEALFADDKGELISHEDKKLFEALQEIKLEYLDVEDPLDAVDYLNYEQLSSIYLAGFVKSLNVIRKNNNKPALNLVGTAPNIPNLSNFITLLRANEKLGLRVNSCAIRCFSVMPITFIASSALKMFYCRMPSPFLISIVASTVDYLICNQSLREELDIYGLDKREMKVVDYIVSAQREQFVKQQMENYVKTNPHVKEVFLCFGAAHEFSELQNSELFEFVNPPKVTKEVVKFEDIKDDYQKFLNRVQSLRSKL
ncbi:MAG: hypothetical protein AB8G05_28105 [Oligoflexales bacterium]